MSLPLLAFAWHHSPMRTWFIHRRFTQALADPKREDEALSLLPLLDAARVERHLDCLPCGAFTQAIFVDQWRVAAAWMPTLPERLQVLAQRRNEPWSAATPLLSLQAQMPGFGSWFVERYGYTMRDADYVLTPTTRAAHEVLRGLVALGLDLSNRYQFNRHTTYWEDEGPQQTLGEYLESHVRHWSLEHWDAQLEAQDLTWELAQMMGEAPRVVRRPRL